MGHMKKAVGAFAALMILGITFAAPAQASHGQVEFLVIGCAGDTLALAAIDGEAVTFSPTAPTAALGVAGGLVDIPESIDITGSNIFSVVCLASGRSISAGFGETNFGQVDDENNYTDAADLILIVSPVGGVAEVSFLLTPLTPLTSPAGETVTPEVKGKTLSLLAQTGTESLPLAQQGLGLIAFGGLVLFAARRRRASLITV